ncbi:prephenate dehydratase [Loigolactobacillus bifermentans]|uniref:Prephenate dehydratase n=1 Tax=Loigolactobacillus bifermentans DSM 20003 TaxID=1423726 RepID=A0A0R1H593_9LACO|nr:prephenate dehydratase domain-containing protein [Loigolactobacillus bifermentans]KRK38961.1 prephenate dehydratase [Loigolactobacillus bifermentans DSM 20003]QGG59152.1 prephenate dehydratase [Loigolactobacillus bifermentans]
MTRLAVLGPAGTFSDVAAQQYQQTHSEIDQLVYYDNIGKVGQSVDCKGQLAILPLENTLDGYVERTLTLLKAGQLHVVGTATVPVHFALVANCQRLDQVKRVYVQFKTKGQCLNILHQMPQAELSITESNMLSFNKLKTAEFGDAAIIPQFHLSDLPQTADFLIREQVADSLENETRFIVVQAVAARVPIVKFDATETFRFLCYITPNTDRSGLLYDILGYFARANLNLIALMSGPTKRKMGTYSFYIEVGGLGQHIPELQKTLDTLRKNNYQVLDLGLFAAKF